MEENERSSINNLIVKYYEIPLENIIKISRNSYYITDNNNREYFYKYAPINALKKYQFLVSQGIDNVIYPTLNTKNEYITSLNNKAFYITDYYKDNSVVEERKAINMVNELRKLHVQTTIKRQLSVRSSRPKFEMITSYLDYKFRTLEDFIRSIEVRALDTFSMPILGNYQYILDAKKELTRLELRIISSIKGKEKVDYVFVHNRPSLDHMINVKGINFLTSAENGKIGVSSLDIAKFYVSCEHLNLDFNEIIVKEYFNGENSFYYDYFRFLVLYIYIKRIIISSDLYLSSESIISASESIKRFFSLFLDNKENVSDENESDDK